MCVLGHAAESETSLNAVAQFFCDTEIIFLNKFFCNTPIIFPNKLIVCDFFCPTFLYFCAS